MRQLVGCLLGLILLIAPAHAQVDPDNPEHQFQAFAVMSSSAKRCHISDTLDERIAGSFAHQMMGADNTEAEKAYNDIYAQAKATDCANPLMAQYFAVAAPFALKAADGVALAYLDQGYCHSTADFGMARLYAAYRRAGMSAERKAAAEETRADWRTAFGEACQKDDRFALGDGFTFIGAIQVWDFFPAMNGSCRSDWDKTLGPYECEYGPRPVGPSFYDDKMRLGRQSVRAAQAKALALELDRAAECKAFTAAERAAGEAQMKADARLGVGRFNARSKTVANNLDPEKAYKTPEEAIAAGRKLAAGKSCQELGAPLPDLDPDAPDTQKGEQVLAAAGANRIRETLDRAAMVLVSLPSCSALPHFAASQKSAEAYVDGMTPQRRLVAAAESAPLVVEIDRLTCDATSLGQAFKATPLYAVDALDGVW